MEGLSRRRTVVSLSLSAANPDAVLVAQALAERGIAVTHGGNQILAWAAAFLSGATNAATSLHDEPGLSEEEVDSLLDDF